MLIYLTFRPLNTDLRPLGKIVLLVAAARGCFVSLNIEVGEAMENATTRFLPCYRLVGEARSRSWSETFYLIRQFGCFVDQSSAIPSLVNYLELLRDKILYKVDLGIFHIIALLLVEIKAGPLSDLSCEVEQG